ncbi:hypothetical protein QR680_015072 [Steinernema hermaphroditum]|uniref:Serpentine receptor class gamma n=1 Tax=Steinernema hermaphroditum TaxID=289476 RepID=A0AA39M4A7_9BILA|nr:hypothetical protein QR680_015072 [Steinernema hermaphroditum]
MWSETSIGFIYLAFGCIYVLPGIICFSVLIRPPLFHQSSYKLMCFISLLDILNIAACCFFAGFYSIFDSTYQNTPSMLTVGSVTLALWVVYCASNILLAIDRLICFCSKRLSDALFAGHRTFYWIGVALVAGFQMIIPFDGELFYHYDSSIGGWRFEFLPAGTRNYRHMFINIGTFAMLLLLYAAVVIRLLTMSTQDKVQSKAVIHSAAMCGAICGFAMGADIFCIIVQNIQNPSVAMCYAANLAWQLAHGGTGYAYLSMNKTIREAAIQRAREFFNLFKCSKTKVVQVQTIASRSLNA